MKPVRIIEGGQKEKQIDWDKPQWFISDANIIVCSNGNHKIGVFKGTCLPHKNHPSGRFASHWDKSLFKPIEKPIIIEISND